MWYGSRLPKRSAPRDSRTPEDLEASRAAALKLFLPPALESPGEAVLQLTLGLRPMPHGAASWWGRACVASSQQFGKTPAQGEPRLLSASPEGAGEGRSVAPPGPQQNLGQCMAAQGPLERIIKFLARQSTSLIARTAPPHQGGLLQPKGPHTSSILCHVKGHRIYGREPGLTSKA